MVTQKDMTMKPIKAAIISLSGPTLTDEEKTLIEQENPFGVSLFDRNIENPRQLKQLTDSIKTISGRNDIIIATDQEGGRVCRLKKPHFRSYLAQAAIGSLGISYAEQTAQLHAELIADDLHSVGINCNFAPTLDVATPTLTKALKSRCFSRNSQIVTRLSQIMIDVYNQKGIVPCIKHLPGHSGAENDPHLQLSTIRHAYKRHLYPFEQIAPHALMAITAHIVLSEIDNLPITMSKKAITSLIRGQFNFKGLLISDALEMKSLSGTLKEKTIACREAGCDAVCYCHGDMENLTIVLQHCGYLSDKTLEVYKQISDLTACSYRADDIAVKEKEYQRLAAMTQPIIDDYDAVEVLNQL